MEYVASGSTTSESRLPRVNFDAISIWLLAGGLVLYLAVAGGGYDIVVHSQVAIVIWWLVLLGCAWGILRTDRVTRAGWTGLLLFGAFVCWTALASTWSLSSERSLEALSLVVGYLGVLVLGLSFNRDRRQALRHTTAATGVAIVIVAVLAIASRLDPGLVKGAGQTASFVAGAQSRLDWPLNYWNALAALMALGLPLLLAIATSERPLAVQCAASAGLPLLILCAYLTFSRGGAIESAVGVTVFIALAPERIWKLATSLSAAAAGAVLVAAASHRPAIEHGLTASGSAGQARSLVVTIVLVCAGAALVQVGIGLSARHARLPRVLEISPRRARVLLAAGAVVLVAAVVVLFASGAVSHAWQQFKLRTPAELRSTSLQRFGAANGEGRYDYWKAALASTSGHLLTGSGPGTFQLIWLQRAPFYSFVENAHSLYFETLAEVGLVGLTLLVAFLVLVVVVAVRVVVSCEGETRTNGAGVAGAMIAFLVAAGIDWVWQVPVIPTIFMLLAAAVLGPSIRLSVTRAVPRRWSGWAIRGLGMALALGSLVAVAVPLATTNAERSSQSAAQDDNLGLALADAQTAERLEPGAASPRIQIALVLEAEGDASGALVPARQAAALEPAEWSTWLVLSRLEAETGHPSASVAAYRRARSLNPRSPVFTS